MNDSVQLTLVDEVIERALAEDLGGGDPTSEATTPADAVASAWMLAKAPLAVCGLSVAQRVFVRLSKDIRFVAAVAEGTCVPKGTRLARIEGNARAILAAERTALNLVQRMTGTATLTRAFVDAVDGKCRIVDTRKTTPGLRALQRYAVRCGGGRNHRDDLGGGVLIKENHIRAAGGVAAAVTAARAQAPHALRIECEVTDLDELEQALTAKADIVMLDNMDDAMVERAVAQIAGRAIIEVSGNMTVARAPILAALGVDVISVGALTHSAPAADISLLFDTEASG
ncbi:MAG: carboxylating nicotinate-nucleotide diphosphorylase [Nannocystaceae bacterium]|nr:carboxylating nicotinate-nucleotide diphosphorylase [Nannocystaceae bacterium]